MPDPTSLLSSLANSPLSSVFVITGLFFVNQSLFPRKGVNRRLSGIIGCLLAILGISLYFISAGVFSQLPSPLPNPPVNTPVPTPQVGSSSPAKDPAPANNTGQLPSSVVVAVMPAPLGASTASSFLTSKCPWLQMNMPLIKEKLTQQSGISLAQMQLLQLGCGQIVDGLFIHGESEIEIAVPDGACVDAPPDAVFTGDTQSRSWGIRAYSGIVRYHSLVYYPWCDERFHIPLQSSG